MSKPKPSAGRIVHYVSYGTPGGEFDSVCRAAVITEVVDEFHVSLAVLNPSGLFFDRGLSHEPVLPGTNPPVGTWHWPEMV